MVRDALVVIVLQFVKNVKKDGLLTRMVLAVAVKKTVLSVQMKKNV